MKQLFRNVTLSLALIASSLAFAKTSHNVVLVVLPGCHYCSQAEKILNGHGIKFKTSIAERGSVPQLYVDGEYKGTGVDVVQEWADANQ